VTRRGAARPQSFPSETARLREWQTLHLEGASLEGPEARALAERLSSERKLTIRELRSGLELEATSYVGSVRLGALGVVIEPKLAGGPLLRLFRYAHGLGDLTLLPPTGHEGAEPLFQDLIVAQLCAEARELLARGLSRRYVERDEALSSPRGRLDLRRLAASGGVTSGTLPCRHHARTEDWPLNRVLRAGLGLAADVAADPTLSREARSLEARMAPRVGLVALSGSSLAQARRSLDRLSSELAPALALVELLADGSGVTPGEHGTAQLPGFLFDMSRFFQALLGRFLRENLPALDVHEERSLGELLRYAPGHNPRGRPAPRPRPDFALLDRGRVVALLDAKYRDLWAEPLPREMLYQLAIYALSQGPRGSAAILYPSLDPAAIEAKIELREPFGPWGLRSVVLRPVPLDELDRLLVSAPLPGAGAARAALALALAFGGAGGRSSGG
jgi:5-methylcytosine-specific restriction enzyme subunit McrC